MDLGQKGRALDGPHGVRLGRGLRRVGAEHRAAPLPFQGLRIVVAAVGDPSVLPTVNAQRGEWEANGGGLCVVQEEAVEPSDLTGVQVLVFRGERLGDLVDVGALAVLPESALQPPAAPAPGGVDSERDADDGHRRRPSPTRRA